MYFLEKLMDEELVQLQWHAKKKKKKPVCTYGRIKQKRLPGSIVIGQSLKATNEERSLLFLPVMNQYLFPFIPCTTCMYNAACRKINAKVLNPFLTRSLPPLSLLLSKSQPCSRYCTVTHDLTKSRTGVGNLNLESGIWI